VGHISYEVIEKVETLREDADAAAICCVGTAAFDIYDTFPAPLLPPTNTAYHAAFRVTNVPRKRVSNDSRIA
jgi:hypothetical protein